MVPRLLFDQWTGQQFGQLFGQPRKQAELRELLLETARWLLEDIPDIWVTCVSVSSGSVVWTTVSDNIWVCSLDTCIWCYM